MLSIKTYKDRLWSKCSQSFTHKFIGFFFVNPSALGCAGWVRELIQPIKNPQQYYLYYLQRFSFGDPIQARITPKNGRLNKN